jgi:hypothetical protein
LLLLWNFVHLLRCMSIMNQHSRRACVSYTMKEWKVAWLKFWANSKVHLALSRWNHYKSLTFSEAHPFMLEAWLLYLLQVNTRGHIEDTLLFDCHRVSFHLSRKRNFDFIWQHSSVDWSDWRYDIRCS